MIKNETVFIADISYEEVICDGCGYQMSRPQPHSDPLRYYCKICRKEEYVELKGIPYPRILITFSNGKQKEVQMYE